MKKYTEGSFAVVGFPQDRLDLLEKIVNRLAVDNPTADILHKRLEGLLEEEISLPKEPTAPKPALFSVIATTNLGAMTSEKTAKCFVGKRYAGRDPDFDNWLSKTQPSTEPCVIKTLGFEKDWVFIEAVHAIPDAPQTDDVVELGNWLIENGYTMTPQQAENMVEKTEANEKTEMRTDGYANFFFVETGDPNNPVSVGYVHRDGRAWNARVRSLGYGYRWNADRRLLIRNLLDA